MRSRFRRDLRGSIPMNEKSTARTDALMDGREYLESLRDARQADRYDEGVAHVTTHPSARNAASPSARLYGSPDPADTRDDLTTVARNRIRKHRGFTQTSAAS